jgi:hypothetical protein
VHLLTVSCFAAAVVAAAKVFAAVQGHWLSACLGVMLQLKIADILVDHTNSSSSHANAPAGQGGAASGSSSAAEADTGTGIEQVRCSHLVRQVHCESCRQGLCRPVPQCVESSKYSALRPVH